MRPTSYPEPASGRKSDTGSTKALPPTHPSAGDKRFDGLEEQSPSGRPQRAAQRPRLWLRGEQATALIEEAEAGHGLTGTGPERNPHSQRVQLIPTDLVDHSQELHSTALRSCAEARIRAQYL